MTFDQAVKRARNPKAFYPGEMWVVLNSAGEPVQSDASETRAQASVTILNGHERRNGRPGGYTYEPLEKAP